jgi:hypothetical protein
MSWLLIGALAWCVLAPAVALVLGQAFRRGHGDVVPAAWTGEVDTFLRRRPAQESPMRPGGTPSSDERLGSRT